MDGFSFIVQNVFLIPLFPSIFVSDLSLVFYIGETCLCVKCPVRRMMAVSIMDDTLTVQLHQGAAVWENV